MSHPASAQPSIPPRQLARLAALAALVGIPVGLVAFGYVAVLHVVQHALWHQLPELLGQESPPWYLLLGLPVLGALLVHLARLLPGDGGHSPLHHGLPDGTQSRAMWSVALAALASLAFGFVLGPEAPLVLLGAGVAVWLTRWARLGTDAQSLIGAAGSSAALSTLFGGPLVAGVMLLETGAGAGLPIIPILLPALSSAAVGYVLITGLGQWSGLPIKGLVLPDLPRYDTVLIRDLAVAIVAGLVLAVVALAIRWLAGRVAGVEDRVGRLPLLLAAGLVVGLSAWGATLFGADAIDVLFSGQESVVPLTQATAGVVVVLFVAKGVAFAVSLGAGLRGGPVFPAIFLGVAVADIGVLTYGMSPTVAIAIGTAAGMTAMTRTMLSSILFAALLVGGAGLETIPVATAAAVSAWLGSALLDRYLLRRRADADAASTSIASAGSALPAPADE